MEVRDYARCKEAYDMPKGEQRDKALERYHVDGEPKPVLRAVEANAVELFRERNPHIRLGQTKANG